MDSFELNKILGALLGTCLFLLVMNIAAGAIFTPPKLAKPGFEIVVPDAPGGEAARGPAEPPKPIEGAYYQAKPIYPLWVSLITSVIQLHIVLGKTLMIAWIFIWVRWTLPRFRYDQIMSLGWKVMLNIALVNLLLTALIAKLVR